ncbi:MAG: hypothetical protein AAF943_08540 [Pseudomonadota bacterium]
MKAHTASMLNALILIACAAWGYWATDMKSVTALIPAGFGIALLLCYPGVKSENKIIAHVAVLLTLILLFALYMPLSSALIDGGSGSLLRALLMVGSTLFALVCFVKSFRDARRARGSA